MENKISLEKKKADEEMKVENCIWCEKEIEGSHIYNYFCSFDCYNSYNEARSLINSIILSKFKPHRGIHGELLFAISREETPKISFIPAFFSKDKETSLEYLRNHYPPSEVSKIEKQIISYFDGLQKDIINLEKTPIWLSVIAEIKRIYGKEEEVLADG